MKFHAERLSAKIYIRATPVLVFTSCMESLPNVTAPSTETNSNWSLFLNLRISRILLIGASDGISRQGIFCGIYTRDLLHRVNDQSGAAVYRGNTILRIPHVFRLNKCFLFTERLQTSPHFLRTIAEDTFNAATGGVQKHLKQRKPWTRYLHGGCPVDSHRVIGPSLVSTPSNQSVWYSFPTRC